MKARNHQRRFEIKDTKEDTRYSMQGKVYMMKKEKNTAKAESVTNMDVTVPAGTSFINIKERLVEEARGFNLLSNIFMSVALKDISACQHVVRIITGIPDLIVREVRPQYRISKITAHDSILDILAEDGQGRLVNLEIQRKDTIDHARRTRFYSAMIDSECLQKGKEYNEMPDVYIIYISETDLWKAGRTVYNVKKNFEGTELSYNDGVYITYVNAEVDDGSDIAKLMDYFKTAHPEDMSQGDLSARIHFLKCEEGGYQEMCEVSEKIYNEGRLEGRSEGRLEGRLESTKETAFNMKEKGYPDDVIADILKTGLNVLQQWWAERNLARP